VILNTSADESMQNEGISREIINRIQKLRKKAHLVPTDKVTVYLKYDESLAHVVEQYGEGIQNAIKAPVLPYPPTGSDVKFFICESFMIKESTLHVAIVKEEEGGGGAAADIGSPPSCKFVNVSLRDDSLRPDKSRGWLGSILLENPVGKSALNLDQLHSSVEDIFLLHGKPFVMIDCNGQKVTDVSKLVPGTSVLITKDVGDSLYLDDPIVIDDKPFVPFINVSGGKGGGEATVLLENPWGTPVFPSLEEAKKFGETTLLLL